MEINSGKRHILFSGNGNVSANISESKNELLGIIFDLKDHVNNVKKTSQKLNVLARIARYMCLEKRKAVIKHI